MVLVNESKELINIYSVTKMRPANHKLVFIVEDNEMYSMMLDYKLKKLINYESKKYINGEDCVKELHLNPDLILLDYLLPNKNGLDILHEIKKVHKNIPVVILSSQQDVNVAIALFKEGIYDYLTKDEDTFLKLEKIMRKIFSVTPQSKKIAMN